MDPVLHPGLDHVYGVLPSTLQPPAMAPNTATTGFGQVCSGQLLCDLLRVSMVENLMAWLEPASGVWKGVRPLYSPERPSFLNNGSSMHQPTVLRALLPLVTDEPHLGGSPPRSTTRVASATLHPAHTQACLEETAVHLHQQNDLPGQMFQTWPA